MNRTTILVSAALVMFGLGACSAKSITTGPTTTAQATTSSTPHGSTPASTSTTISTSSTTTAGPVLAGQPGATSRSALGFVVGYRETTIEAIGLGDIRSYDPTLDTPGTQVHCPGVVASVGATFVCQVDANATSSVDEPLKVDALSPLKVEFAVVNPAAFVCSAHAAWVVQAMAKVGTPCSSAPTTNQGQGGQGGQGQGQSGQGGQGQGQGGQGQGGGQ